MSNLSVKLDENTQLRLKALASRRGVTPHALMVQAIGGELDRIEAEVGFVERAIKAQARAEAGGPVYDGPAYATYLRERVQSALKGQKPSVKIPKPLTLTAAEKKKAPA
jgi:predicted transcriptional regulator